jgi:hypothetical protein
MSSKIIFTNISRIFLILILFCPAMAQMRRVHVFKNVEIPFNLKHEDTVFEKGKYDFEILADRSLNMFNLKIIRNGKNLCILNGEILRAEAPGARGEKMLEVPDEPTLKMNRIPAKNIVNITVETGKLARIFPYYKLRFQMEYE